MFLKSTLTFALLSLLTITNSYATVLMNLPEPHLQHDLGQTGYTLYLGGNSNGTMASGFYNGTQGYRFINTQTGLIYLDIRTDATIGLASGQTIAASITAGGNKIALTGAGYVTGTDAPPTCATSLGACTTDTTGNYVFATYNAGSTLRVSFTVSALCAASSITSLCNGTGASATFTGTTTPISLTLGFGAATTAGGQSTVASNADSGSFNLVITDVAPSVSCPATTNPEDYYFPGDLQVYITPSQFPSTTNSGAPMRFLLMLANRSAVNGIGSNAIPSNEIIGYIDAAGGRSAVTEFVNTETGSDNAYNAVMYGQNYAGLISASDVSNTCVFPMQVFSQEIAGVLTESKCFIATAAFQDGRAAPVMMLRQFRDEILTQTKFGRSFIENYYRFSPALAEWAWNKPIIRSFALKVLAPIELMAWAILKFAHAEETPSVQPYVDRLKKKITADEQPSEESYTEKLKRELGAPEDATGYTDRLKTELGAPEDSSGYTENLRPSIPGDGRESQIQAVMEGRDKYPRPERPRIKHGVSFRVGVSPGISVTNTATANTFNTVYGADWKPDLLLHYERQLFHSENFGSFALGVDFGASYAEGFGLLRFPFGSTGTTTSVTKMNFIQLPLIANAYYRFNLLRILRPYVGGGVGTIGYVELRNDPRPDRRGYSLVYTGSAGVSLLLDFMDPSTARDGFLSGGIQHTYLFAEFMTLKSFETAGVTFERNGIYSGFLFEY